MGYQVLARKWRPSVFAQLVGQQHVVSAISNALDNNRLHHAYLFTGTRGVGKTTIARIFSKSLNCEKGMSSTPCGQCATCQEIEQGNYVDLLEIDAASRTKVEDTRDLLDNVQYKPTRGEYKVYLIDEVHMLSKHSFNALLKTLEEPPPHVKFLLATTDPQKLPITILSRCLQFNLKALSRQQIEQQLQHILQQEGIAHEAAALAQLAKAAQGSMRDALSLTDQAIAQGNNNVSLQIVSDMLGLMDKNQVLKLLHAVLNKDSEATLQQVEQLSYQAPDYGRLLSEIMSLLHQIALTQFVADACKLETSSPRAIYQLAKEIAPEHVQLLYQIALQGRKDLPHAADGRSGLEMTLLRMLAFRPDKQVLPAAEIANYAVAPEPQDSAPVDQVGSSAESAELFAQQQQLEQQAQQLQSQSAAALPPLTAHTPVESAPIATVNAAAEQQQARADTPFPEPPPPAAPAVTATDSLSAMERKLALARQLRGTSGGEGATAEKKPERAADKGPSPAVQCDPVVKEAHKLSTDNPPLTPPPSPPVAEQAMASKSTEVDHVTSVPAYTRSQLSADTPPWLQQTDSQQIDPGLADFLGAERPQLEQASAFDATAHLQDELDYPVDITVPVFLPDGQKVLAAHQLDHWSQLIEAMPVAALTKQLALHSSYQFADDKVTLLLSEDKQHLHTDIAVSQLQQALEQILRQPIELHIGYGQPINTPYGLQQQITNVRQQHALEVAHTDPTISELCTVFNASIVEGSVKPR